MQRLERLIQEPIQIEHVRPAPGEKGTGDAQRRVGARDLAPFEIDEQRRSLRGELRLLGQLLKELCHARVNRHRSHGTTRTFERCARPE